MNQVIIDVNERLNEIPLSFINKPIIIGGMAMEYYGMRKAGRDIDLIISQDDYHVQIWRSIALIDYDFFLKDAIDEGNVLIVSIGRLLWMRVCAMEVEKYKKDLYLMKEYYYTNFRNQNYLQEYSVRNPSGKL